MDDENPQMCVHERRGEAGVRWRCSDSGLSDSGMNLLMSDDRWVNSKGRLALNWRFKFKFKSERRKDDWRLLNMSCGGGVEYLMNKAGEPTVGDPDRIGARGG